MIKKIEKSVRTKTNLYRKRKLNLHLKKENDNYQKRKKNTQKHGKRYKGIFCSKKSLKKSWMDLNIHLGLFLD